MSKFDGVFVLTDMDGTLLNSCAEISDKDSKAIDYFIDNGGLFSVATGRAKGSVERFLPKLRTSAPSVVHNGSLTVDLQDNTVVRRLDLGERAEDMVEDILDRFPLIAIEISLPDDQYVARGNSLSERHHRNVGLEYKLKSFREVPLPWLKLNLVADHEVLLDAREYMMREYKEGFFAQFSLPHYYEVMAAGASKGDSALWLRDYLRVGPEDFYTVGDGTNDIELLRASGANSHAVANAKPPVLEAAASVLPDNDSGAIAALIEKLDGKY